jgi:hypothetical protein
VPNLHLTKVAFGCASLEALQNRIARRATRGELRVPTRMRPKRADELVGGSLHWIVKHRIVARQEILRIDDRNDGRIDIVCSAELVMLPPVPKRAHQGWRYLEDKDAPRDLGRNLDDLAQMPEAMRRELADLGLL